jgi:hypothetical protein
MIRAVRAPSASPEAVGLPASPPLARWRRAWLGLAAALGLHVTDEALTDFLPAYNRVVSSMRESVPWLALPTFTFPVWLTGLVLLVATLFALTPMLLRGARWLRPVSYFLGVLMVGNALGHLGASILLRRVAPGALSSPVLLVAAVSLLIATRRSRPATEDPCPE